MFCAVHPQSSRICAPTHEMGRNFEGNGKFIPFAILNAIIFERSSNKGMEKKKSKADFDLGRRE